MDLEVESYIICTKMCDMNLICQIPYALNNSTWSPLEHTHTPNKFNHNSDLCPIRN